MISLLGLPQLTAAPCWAARPCFQWDHPRQWDSDVGPSRTPWDEGVESPGGWELRPLLWYLLFTLMSPNMAGRLCVFVPKARW